MAKIKLGQLIKEDKSPNKIRKEKNKLTKYLIKRGSNKRDAEEMVERHYDYVMDTYKDEIPLAKKAEIISSLSALGY